MTTTKIDYTNCYSQTVNNALSHFKGANRVAKLLAAEAILENVISNIDEDDLATDMLEQVLEILAVIIERS